MLRELCQLGESADESGGVLKLCFITPLLHEDVQLLLQLLLFLLFLSLCKGGGALNLIISPPIAHISEKLTLSFRRKS